MEGRKKRKKERKKNEKRDSVRRTRTVFTKEKTKWMDREREGGKERVPLGGRRLDHEGEDQGDGIAMGLIRFLQ